MLEHKKLAAEKGLKIFNGRWGYNNSQHIYVCAKSKADAMRLACQTEVNSELLTPSRIMREINVYWSDGAWGNEMAYAVPERGVWIKENNSDAKPKRVV